MTATAGSILIKNYLGAADSLDVAFSLLSAAVIMTQDPDFGDLKNDAEAMAQVVLHARAYVEQARAAIEQGREAV